MVSKERGEFSCQIKLYIDGIQELIELLGKRTSQTTPPPPRQWPKKFLY